MTTEYVPLWRLREELKRQAEEIINGRARFEQHAGRTSTKPLPKVEVDAHNLLRLLREETP